MLAIDPLSYFSHCDLEESLLIRFVFRPQAQMLDLVIRYAADAVSEWIADRKAGRAPTNPPVVFRHFRFNAVEMLQSGNGTIVPVTDWSTYERLLLASPQVLTGVNHTTSADAVVLSFILGRFGIHRLAYQLASAEDRSAVGIQATERTWVYHDCTTNEIVNFNNPFPTIEP